MKPLKGQGQPLLFLDFDGVLHNEACYWHPRRGPYLKAPPRYTLFQHAELLAQLLEPYPNVAIVLSTSWVRQYSCDKAARRLPPALRRRVIGATYHREMPGDSFAYLSRGEQVTADVLRRKPSSWLALDDDPIGWPEWSLPHLLLTDPYEGISLPELVEELRLRLALLASAPLLPRTSP
jgi:hypothetical protein